MLLLLFLVSLPVVFCACMHVAEAACRKSTGLVDDDGKDDGNNKDVADLTNEN